ncbi:MAG: hypothetical protein G8345_00715 [Magnetococcales bacterium]|nr:TraU family protein [Magnetococcales bacterium]NGZ25390.1 hypothetical protein [Magnetococcales bacterium]
MCSFRRVVVILTGLWCSLHLAVAAPVSDRWLFVSLSMPDGEIKSALADAATHSATVVFRGVAPGDSLVSLYRRIASLAHGLEPVPEVVIDPVLFEKHGIDVVPALVVMEDHRPIKSVRGLASFAWLLDQEEKGDFGRRGTTWAVLEPNMIVEIKRRMLSLDWETMRAKAVGQFWRQAPFVELPEVRESRTRRFNPAVYLTQDLALPDGRVFAAANQIINPLEMLPFTKTVIAFDPKISRQVTLAERLHREILAQGRGTILLVSRLDRERGWEEHAELERRLGAPVYLLNDEIVRGLHLERLPATIKADGKTLVVTEYPAMMEMGGLELDLLGILIGTAWADEGSGNAQIMCPNAEIFGQRMINGVCWSCMFPVRLFGTSNGTGATPAGAAGGGVCTCQGAGGIPQFGITAGFWAPARMIEIVRQPYCSPVMGGIKFESGVRHWGGQRTTEYDISDSTFYNYHYWAFPLFVMLELLGEPNCNAGGYNSLDLMYLSELDPTWNESELAFLLSPESAVFANPLAQAACIADCATVSAGGLPLESQFWCAGCWGGMYPLTGTINWEASPVRDSSLLAARAVAALHRRGVAWKTYGSENLCGGNLYPMIPKQQYRMSMLFPFAEATGNCCHFIGDSTFKWGEWRTMPGTGEDFVYLLWRYTDCCLH